MEDEACGKAGRSGWMVCVVCIVDMESSCCGHGSESVLKVDWRVREEEKKRWAKEPLIWT